VFGRGRRDFPEGAMKVEWTGEGSPH